MTGDSGGLSATGAPASGSSLWDIPTGTSTTPSTPYASKDSDVPRVFVTIPARNERVRLERTVAQVEEVLRHSKYDCRLGIAEDGSNDGSAGLVLDLARDRPDLIVQSFAARQGRGLALRKLWGSVVSDIYVFTDADLAAGPRAILDAIEVVERGADLAIGSRLLRESRVVRPPLRHWVSRVYNWTVRRAFGDGVADHQCGLKAFSHRAVTELLPLTSEDTWFWDTEVVVRACRRGLKVVEFPVTWYETKYPRTPIRRLMADVWLHGLGLLRLRESLRATSQDARRAAGIESLAPGPIRERRSEVERTG